MLTLAVTAALAAAGPDLIDWPKATDDTRFALLKPVMTATEVERLRIGKEDFAQACGSAKDENGNWVGSYDGIYSYQLTGREEGVCIRFTVQYVYRDPNKPRTDTRAAGWGENPWMRPAPERTKPNLVSFRADGVLYRRDKNGLYVAESGKK